MLVWFFCLKASNKFKSFQYLNYLLSFLLSNLLGGMLFMFLSKQFYQSAVCVVDKETTTIVMRANTEIECWTKGGEQLTYALRGMFGMSVFVPLAVLAFGSYQVFFPAVNLDVVGCVPCAQFSLSGSVSGRLARWQRRAASAGDQVQRVLDLVGVVHHAIAAADCD